MAVTIYTKVLPNLQPATKRVGYDRLIRLIEHLEPFGIDMLAYQFDVPTRTVTITLTGPVPQDNITHLELD